MASTDEMLQMIEGRLVELECESKNIQTIIQETSTGIQAFMMNKSSS